MENLYKKLFKLKNLAFGCSCSAICSWAIKVHTYLPFSETSVNFSGTANNADDLIPHNLRLTTDAIEMTRV